MEHFMADLLECFCALVETNSFAKAGDKIGRSQPAVSQRIKELEKRVGLSLYDRKKRCPTTLGKRFYEAAKSYLRVHRRYNLLFNEIFKGRVTELKIGASDSFACYILPAVIKKILADYPTLQLSVITRNSAEIETLVVNGDVNLGVVTGPVELTELEQEIVYQTSLKIVVPKKLKVSKSVLRLEELIDEPFISITPTTRTGKLIWDYMRFKKLYPKCVIDSGSFSVVMEYVSQGFGYSIVPEIVTRDWKSRVSIYQIDKSPNINFFCVFPRGFPLSEVERKLLEILRVVRN